MRLLIADDDAVLRHGLAVSLERWGYDVTVCTDGHEAAARLFGPDPPPIALLDWSMPGMDGISLCRAVRGDPATASTYVILITARDAREDVVRGLEGGADEYITKPVDWDMLRMRLHVASRMVSLQQDLAARVAELEAALAQVKTLSGLLPICSYCKRIRDDGDYWRQLEGYISEHTDAQFSHGVCPECYQKALKDLGRDG